jgi:hypothetical protein
MTTDEYRTRFGSLAFACAAGTELYLPLSVQLMDNREIRGFLANNPSRASIHVTEEIEYRLPPEVLDAGSIRLTGVIHRLTAKPWVWLQLLPKNSDPCGWPEEAGGSDTFQKIIARCDAIRRASTQSDVAEKHPGLDGIDEELTTLLAPERNRLQRQMILAISRMITVVY